MSSISSITLTTVAQLNNKATQHMTLGEHTQAIVSLAQAASSLKQIFINEDGSTSQVRMVEEQDSDQQRRAGHYNDGTSRLLSFDFLPPKEKNHEENSAASWYIYKYAIHVVVCVDPHQAPPAASSSRSPSFTRMSSSRQRQVASILSYAVNFNLALCYHLIGCGPRSNPKSSSRLLKRAARFYNHSQDLLLRHGARYLLLKGNRGVHEFAIINNMGHVYLCLKRELMASLCSQRLWEAVTYIASSNKKEKTTSTTLTGSNSDSQRQQEKQLIIDRESDSCIAGFVTNVSYLMSTSSSPAPVA